MSSGNTMDVMK